MVSGQRTRRSTDIDVGIAGGNGRFNLAEGKPLYQVEEHEAVNALMAIHR